MNTGFLLPPSSAIRFYCNADFGALLHYNSEGSLKTIGMLPHDEWTHLACKRTVLYKLGLCFLMNKERGNRVMGQDAI